MTTTTPRNARKVCTLLGIGLFTMMLVWVSGTLFLQYILPETGIMQQNNPWFMWVINDVPLYLLGLPLFLLITKFIPQAPVVERPQIRFGIDKFMLCLLFSLGATYLVNIVVTLILVIPQISISGIDEFLENYNTYTTNFTNLSSNPIANIVLSGGMLQNVLFGIFVPAIGEEFIFRFWIRKKMRGCADRTYVFFSAICFGLFHASPMQTPYAFIIGIVLAWVYLVTGKIWLPMLLHFIINAIGILVVPYAISNVFTAISVVALVFILIPLAITFFCVFKRYVFATMLPPTQGSWPYKPPQPNVILKQRQIYGSSALSLYPAYWGNPAAYSVLWGAPPVPYVRKGAGRVCIGNVGMVLYIVLAAALLIANIVYMFI